MDTQALIGNCQAFSNLLHISGNRQDISDFVIMTLDDLLALKTREVVRELTHQVQEDARHFRRKELVTRLDVFLSHLGKPQPQGLILKL